MTPTRIGMILADRVFLPDIRVDKQAAALIANGFGVGLLAGGDENRDAGVAAPAGVEVYRTEAATLSLAGLSPRPKPRLLLDGLSRADRGPAFWRRASGFEGLGFHAGAISRPWADVIRRFILAVRPDVLHAHDLLVLPTVLRVASGFGLPVVADLHENWPAYLEAMAASKSGIERRLFETIWSPARWRRLEEDLLPLCARVIVVVPEAAKRLGAYGIRPESIVVVSNTEPPPAATPAAAPGFEHRWVALYAGSVDHARGLDIILRATARVARVCPEFLLLIVGADQHWRDLLAGLARELKVERHVRVEGWVKKEQIPSYIAASRVCLVPHRNLEHTNTTVPHKLFQYMAHGKPVLVSDCAPLARIVHDSGAGLVFRADSPASAARALIELTREPTAAESMGTRGKEAVAGRYGWRHDAERLVGLYADLMSEL